MPSIVLVNPRFDVSSWRLEHALTIAATRANLPERLPAPAGSPHAG